MSELSNFVQIDCAKANRLKISMFFQMSKDVALVKTTKSLNEDAQNNMIEQLQNAPPSIALLGKLNLLTTETDFSLVEDGEECEYLTQPDSFAACLAQITFAGQDAFQKAEINMERVKLHSERVPGR